MVLDALAEAGVLRVAPPTAFANRGGELHGLVEDMIKVLEAKVQPDLRRGRYPDRKTSKLIAELVRGVARDLDP